MSEEANTWKPFTPFKAKDGQVLIDENGLPPLRTKKERIDWDYVMTLDPRYGSPLKDWNKRNEEEGF